MDTMAVTIPPATMADVMERQPSNKPKPHLMLMKDGTHWKCFHRSTTWTGYGLTKRKAYQHWEGLNDLPPEAVYRG